MVHFHLFPCSCRELKLESSPSRDSLLQKHCSIKVSEGKQAIFKCVQIIYLLDFLIVLCVLKDWVINMPLNTSLYSFFFFFSKIYAKK